GIRDRNVTGVQTCALPILRSLEMRGQTYVILSIILVIIIAVFAVTNVESVEVSYLFWKGSSPLILVILFSALMGGIITLAAGAKKMYGLQREHKQLQHENQEMRTLLEKNGLLKKDKKNPKNA